MESSASNSSSDSGQRLNLTDWTAAKPKFKIPPWKDRLCQSLNNSYASSQSDSSTQSTKTTLKKKPKNKNTRLPPVGIFWDIENCQVPKNKSTSAVVSRIREFFYDKYREAEFLVVCDVKKERPQVIQELHDSQVNLIHVAATSKNAADEKLRQSLRRFAEVYTAPSCVVLISSDINFAADLSDLRYRKKIRVILLHNSNVADALILCANEHYLYPMITEALPQQKLNKGPQVDESAFLLISNLPINSTLAMIKNRLSFLTNNCGGRVTEILLEDGLAFVRFSNLDAANRAQKRIQGEDVFGNKIRAVTPSLRNYAGRKIKGGDGAFRSQEQKRFSHELVNPLSGQTSDFGNRRPRTPLETLQQRVHKTSGSSELSDDCTKFENSSKSVDLIISNLDPTINPKELRRMLVNMLKECTMIVSLNISVQSDGVPVGNLRVNNQHAAQYVISQLHRQKLGHKRIVVSYAQNNSPDPDQLRAMVISILQEVPDNHMPLFKFIELLESRFHCTVSVSEMNKLKDICKITDNLGARIISFAQDIKTSPLPNLHKTLVPYCTIHCSKGMPNLGWCELNTIQPPNILMPLKIFSSKLNTLLNIHLGCMPLLTFQACYEHEFQESLLVEVNGVPLEHLIICVKNIEIKLTGPNKNIKLIKRDFKTVETDEEAVMKQVPAALVSNINLFCRELVDLLKTTERCQILLSKFIPAYHHHFGRQCHVADYGYTKLFDLFEAISHVVQILGDGTRKMITLSHQAQIRRFTSDLLRVLKVQPCKQIAARDFPAAYEKVLSRCFNPVDYGLCYFEDLLEEVPENVVVLSFSDGDIFVAVPKREQTAVEIMRTKQFAMKVIDLLRHSPNCTMLFNKFVPAYHHHFGHQCRVSDYGFTKLIELFEAIPDVVKIQELPDGERTVSLTANQALKVLGSQLVNLAKNFQSSNIPVNELPKLYLKEYGYPLRAQTYGCTNVYELMEKVSDYVQVMESGAGPSLIPINTDVISTLKIRMWALLLSPPHCKELCNFTYEYQNRYHTELPLNNVNQLRNVASVSSLNDTNYISLTELYVLAAQLYQLLYANGGSVLFNQLDQLYMQQFGKPIHLSQFNINTVDELYEKFDFLFFVCGYKKSVLALNRNLSEFHVAIPVQITHLQKKWPPPPTLPVTQSTAVKCGGGALKKVSPPKPDTPPTPPNLNPWRVSSGDYDLNLAIPLPIIQNPQIMGDPYDLISPARHLFTLNRNPWAKAPHPSELPMPNKLIMKNLFDDSEDSGVNSKMEVSCNDSGLSVKRQGYLNFDN